MPVLSSAYPNTNMVTTQHGRQTEAETQMKGPQPFWTDTCTRWTSRGARELPRCLALESAGHPRNNVRERCDGYRHTQLEQLTKLKEEVAWLRNTQQSEREIDA